jgi:NTP pyrophosphatase (non-canonical NTP hydrolase)
MTVDFNKYVDFVGSVTSPASRDTGEFILRISDLKSQGVDIQRLLTAACGITAEGGEFTEIVKKIAFQGKPYTEENVFHMKRELGDILWYIAQACIALDISFEEIAQMNFEKLTARYPEGTFSIERSENRVANDL